MRLLVIGKNGQLARALGRGGATCVGRSTFDLSAVNVEDALSLLDTYRPDVTINAAGYTAVDEAESSAEAAYALNSAGPRMLAAACAQAAIPLVHISTDYVFDGRKSTPYVESDALNPLGVYGASKQAGEAEVQQSGARTAIVRTSWLYDAEGRNFVRTMLQEARAREEISVVADQCGRPTWTIDLAAACSALAERLAANDTRAEGIFHFADGGDATWADFAEAVFDGARARGWPSASVHRITSSERPTAARRPANSRLDTSKYEALFGAPRSWREALELCMDEMAPP